MSALHSVAHQCSLVIGVDAGKHEMLRDIFSSPPCSCRHRAAFNAEHSSQVSLLKCVLRSCTQVEVDSLSRSVMGYERWREGLQSRIAQRYDLARPHQHLRVESLRGNGEVLQRTSILRQDPSAQWVLAGSITGLCLLSGHIAAFFCGIVGLLYPAYLSLKALESATPADEGCGARAKNARDPKQELLMYWVCYSILHLAEGIMGPCVSQIQHYEAVKVAVLVWLHRQGARSMYDKWLHSAIKEMEAHTEEVVNTVAMQVEICFLDSYFVSLSVFVLRLRVTNFYLYTWTPHNIGGGEICCIKGQDVAYVA